MAAEKSIEKRVIEAVALVFHREASELGPETRFVEDLLAKSVNIIELIAVLEDDLDIEIPMAEARRALTLGEAAAVVERAGGR